MNEFIQEITKDIPYPIEINFLNKKNSSAYFRNGKIVLRVSSKLSKREQKHHISDLLKKILQKRYPADDTNEWDPLNFLFSNNISIHKFDTGETYLGEIKLHNEVAYNVYKKISKNKTIEAKFSRDNIILHLPDNPRPSHIPHLKKLIYRTIAKKQNHYISSIIESINTTYFQKKIRRISTRYVESRWGSCTSKGHIMINSKLLFLPYGYLEYVCIHEIAHLMEMNHTKRFWTIVENIIPDYKSIKKALKKYE